MSRIAPLPGAEAAGLTFRWARRLGAALSAVVALAVVGCLLAVLGLMAAGHRPMIEQSDSMAPVMHAGDVLFVKQIAAAQARTGDIVTFDDAQRPGRTLTHRVVSMKATPDGHIAFVTRGDANTGVERWTVAPDGVVGRYAFGVPSVGRFIALTGSRAWRALVLLAAFVLAIEVLRRIWSSPAPPKSSSPLPTTKR
jgi:signal peptidase I